MNIIEYAGKQLVVETDHKALIGVFKDECDVKTVKRRGFLGYNQ
jgi:hypothetical protein